MKIVYINAKGFKPSELNSILRIFKRPTNFIFEVEKGKQMRLASVLEMNGHNVTIHPNDKGWINRELCYAADIHIFSPRVNVWDIKSEFTYNLNVPFIYEDGKLKLAYKDWE